MLKTSFIQNSWSICVVCVLIKNYKYVYRLLVYKIIIYFILHILIKKEELCDTNIQSVRLRNISPYMALGREKQ